MRSMPRSPKLRPAKAGSFWEPFCGGGGGGSGIFYLLWMNKFLRTKRVRLLVMCSPLLILIFFLGMPKVFNTPQAKCDVHRIDVNAINNENVTFAVYRILGICDVHRIWDRMRRTSHMTLMRCTSCCSNLRMYMRYVKWDVYAIVEDRCICH